MSHPNPSNHAAYLAARDRELAADTLPPPPAGVEVPHGADVAANMRLLIIATRRTLAQQHLDRARARSMVTLNEGDSIEARALGDARLEAWHLRSADEWRGIVARIDREIEETEVSLAQYEAWAAERSAA